MKAGGRRPDNPNTPIKKVFSMLVFENNTKKTMFSVPMTTSKGF